MAQGGRCLGGAPRLAFFSGPTKRSGKMPTGSYPKPNVPKLWRLRGIATDGMEVTLGRYATEEEAQADARRLANDGAYRALVVQPLEAPPAPAADAAPRPNTRV